MFIFRSASDYSGNSRSAMPWASISNICCAVVIACSGSNEPPAILPTSNVESANIASTIGWLVVVVSVRVNSLLPFRPLKNFVRCAAQIDSEAGACAIFPNASRMEFPARPSFFVRSANRHRKLTVKVFLLFRLSDPQLSELHQSPQAFGPGSKPSPSIEEAHWHTTRYVSQS